MSEISRVRLIDQ
uniref:Uncharacterized protein n=1 Tax=Anguilla anguilla TaxID=7936 RepID=A0A0E9PR22_ANGAN